MRVRETCLREYAQGHPAFAQEAEILVRRCYRYCGFKAESVLKNRFDGVTKEVVMHLLLLRAQQPSETGEKLEALLLAEFGVGCDE